MSLEEIKQLYLNRDRAIRVLSKDGLFRCTVIRNTNTIQDAQNKHHLAQLPTLLLGRTLSAASMFTMFLKGEERVVIEVVGNGKISKIFAEAIQVGEVRGYVDFNFEYKKDNKIVIKDFQDALGVGVLKVTRILYNKSEPIQGIVPLVNCDISSDLSYYFSQSEQIPTALLLETEFSDDGKVVLSYGIMIQAMPGYNSKQIDDIYNSLKAQKFISDKFRTESNLTNILEEVLPFEFDILRSTQIDFFCRCSKDNFIQKLITLPVNEIEDMQVKGQNKLNCIYCNTDYYLDNNDFDGIINTIRSKYN